MSRSPARPSLLLDEDALTRRFAELAGPPAAEFVVGIGEDCAVLRPPPEEELVWTLDVQEEGVHFRREWLTLEEMGARAVAAALSDLAAVAARPLGLLLSLTAPPAEMAAGLPRVFEGAAVAARRWGAPVAGGDVSRRYDGLGICATALGTAPHGAAWRRGGARPGDELWVTGTLGLAGRGLDLLQRVGRSGAAGEDAAALERFVAPSPRLAPALWLRSRVAVHAAMDLSDGLARDLPRLCAASGAGARLDAELLEAAGPGGPDSPSRALYGGEDYELLLATGPGALASLSAEFRAHFGLPLRPIGEIVEEPGILLVDRRGARPLPPGGWDHLETSGAARSPAEAGGARVGLGAASGSGPAGADEPPRKGKAP